MQYSLRCEAESQVKQGTVLVWMTLHKYCRVQQEWHGKEFEAASAEFHDKVRTYPDGMVNEDKTMILSVEGAGYIDVSNSRRQVEAATAGNKMERKPLAADISAACDNLGHDHDKFQNSVCGHHVLASGMVLCHCRMWVLVPLRRLPV